MHSGIIILIIIILIALGVIVYLTRGWKCSENGCEFVFGGSFKSKQACQSSCQAKTAAQAASQMAPQAAALSSYICNKNYQCVKVNDNSGEYTSETSCLNNCSPPQKEVVSLPVPFREIVPVPVQGWRRPWGRRRWW